MGCSVAGAAEMNLILPIEVANQIIGYLSTRPYGEVYQLIAAMQEAARPKQPPVQEQPNGGEVDQ